MRDDVEEVIEMIRPAIHMDGGDIELVDVDEASGHVKIRFQGACVGCAMSAVTLQHGIERALKARVPAVNSVEAV